MKKATFGFNINDIAEIAILCSLAIVLDQFCKIPLGATGGSINLSMLPLYIILFLFLSQICFIFLFFIV